MEVGKKVICIDDSIKPEALISVSIMYPNWVKKGKQYTVREFLDNDGIVPGVLLEEVENPIVFIDLIRREQEPAFGLFRFAEEQEAELKEEKIYERDTIEV